MNAIHAESTQDSASSAGISPLPAYREDQLARLAPAELMELLARDEDRAPRVLIDECARRGDAMAEQFALVVENDRTWGDDVGPQEAWLPLHAAMILGLVPTQRAGRLLVSLMRRMEQAQDIDLQDWLSGSWPALFRNKPAAVLAPLRELALDREVDWYMRAQAFEALVAAAEQDGAAALDTALDWTAGIAADETENWDVRLSLADTLIDFPRPRHRALLEALAQRQTGDGRWFSSEEVVEAYASARDDPQWRRFEDPWKFYHPDVIAERQERWAREEAEAMALEDDDTLAEPAQPYVRPIPKVGRNDPCPCGSGKKYKKCCMADIEG